MRFLFYFLQALQFYMALLTRVTCFIPDVIFLMCFNPIVEYLKQCEVSDGYCLNDVHYISLPFADDFNLVTREIRKHRKLMVRLHELTTSMGLKLKPRKCRSLSIRAGTSVEEVFFLGVDGILSVLHDRYHKFLGVLHF